MTRIVMSPELAKMLVRDLTCVQCGRPARNATSHVEEWRDRGHRVLVVEELDPRSDIAMRRVVR